MTQQPALQKLWAHLRARPYYLALLLFPPLLTLCFDVRPLERFPGWDLLWSDSLVAGKLNLNRQGLAEHEIPAISNYHGLGQNIAGDGPALTPFLSPFTPLLRFMDNAAVMQFRFLVYLYLGVFFVHALFRKLNTPAPLAALAAVLYIALPTQFTNQQFYFTIGFYALPGLVLAVLAFVAAPSWLRLFWIGLVAFLVFSATDIFFLIIVPVVVFVAAAFGQIGTPSSLPAKFARLVASVGIAIAGGAFYIVPLYNNLHQIKGASRLLESIGLTSLHPVTTLAGFWEFFQVFGMPSFYLPQPSSALALYLPSFFGFAIVLILCAHPSEGRLSPYRRLGLMTLCIAILMPLISIAYYCLPTALISAGKGVFRYHISLWPFFLLLSSLLLIYDPAIPQRQKLRTLLAAAAVALLVDGFLFCVVRTPPVSNPAQDWFYVNHTAHFNDTIRAVNRFPVRFLEDMWLAVPWMNLMAPALLILGFSGLAVEEPRRRWIRPLAGSGAVILSALWALAYVAVHNELRVTQESGWQEIARSNYHITQYRLRLRELQRLIPADARQNQRLLPASADVFRMQRGRNWKFCADTELLAEAGFKLIFTYREMDHPFTGFLYSKFYPQFASSNFFPPLAENVPPALGVARLLGVRYLLSADTELHDPELTAVGRIDTPNPTFNETAAGGPIFVYEVAGFHSLATFDRQTTVLSQRDAIKRLADWKGRDLLGPLSLEQEPAPAGAATSTARAEVRIAAETLNSVRIEALTPGPGFVSLAYLHRPFWRATVNGSPTPVLRSNGFMMSVAVPAGESHVVFQYIPWDVYAGYLVTLIALATPLALALWSARRAGSSHRAEA